MNRFTRLIKNPSLCIVILDRIGISKLIPDKLYLRVRYKSVFGKKLRLSNPQLYTEKLQWLKLYDHNPLYTTLVDKYTVKDWVKKKIGAEYIIPTIGVWDNVEDIEFTKLPDQYVLKCNHDSGGLVIVRDSHAIDMNEIKTKLSAALKRNYYWEGREWPYKNVKPRIIAEPFLEDKETGELRDYKFFCFSGIPKMVFIATDRQNSEKDTAFDFFDMDFNHLNIKNGHPNAEKEIAKPVNFELMKKLASSLGQGFPEVRVDFYEVNNRVYFGEMTFFHHSGFTAFDPSKWDELLGEWVDISKICIK